jgi:hypothetical protein
MHTRLACLVAAAWLLAGPAAAAQPKPPGNGDCLACHGDATAKADDGRHIGVDPTLFESSTHGPLACVDCHTALASTTEYPHESRLGRVVCASCHDDIGAKYHDSIHAWAKEKAGLVVAPSCADCHGSHDIKAHGDAASRVYRTRVPDTCGTCHAGVKAKFDSGVHAAKLKRGDSRAPSCADCHTAHNIQRADNDSWRLRVTAECGTCHSQVVDSFLRTFHGKVTELGYSRVAACADCHGAHDILPASNSASTVSPSRIVATCKQCHADANASFAEYDPHPNPGNYARNRTLWWANRFYWVLIPSCFGFFGLHSVLWFWRSRKEGRP